MSLEHSSSRLFWPALWVLLVSLADGEAFLSLKEQS